VTTLGLIITLAAIAGLGYAAYRVGRRSEQAERNAEVVKAVERVKHEADEIEVALRGDDSATLAERMRRGGWFRKDRTGGRG